MALHFATKMFVHTVAASTCSDKLMQIGQNLCKLMSKHVQVDADWVKFGTS